MEKKLDVVEAGQADWVKTIDDFTRALKRAWSRPRRIWRASASRSRTSPTDEICEKCGRHGHQSGRYGKFVACSGFPECRNAHPLVKDTGGLCPLDGGHMLVRKAARAASTTAAATTPSAII